MTLALPSIRETAPLPEPRRSGVRGPLLLAAFVMVLFLGGFGAWSMLALLESAAIAPGAVVVDSNRKAIQHLEGGVVAELLVQEGSDVDAGATLVRLDRTSAAANLEMLRGQLMASLALDARLRAERDGADRVVFPPALEHEAEDAKAGEIMLAERRVFATRREQLDAQIRILRQRNVQVEEEIRGLRDEIRAQDRQLELIREEVEVVEQLVARGFERKPRLLLLQRQSAELEGQRSQNVAKIARSQQSIGEGEMRILELQAQMLAESVQKLRDEQTRIYDLTEKIRTAEDVLQRLDIRAPTSGRVVNLKLFTIGGVVTPRETVMEIVPRDESLVVEAQVALNDIDVVRAGLPVQLRFSSLNQRTTPMLEGRVVQVSADRQTDQRTGSSHYTMRAAVDDAGSALSSIPLYPGMPVEVIIVTGQRTLADYLVKPITDSLKRAMRED